jgi:quinoprotein glucose dehydrogenase
VNLFFEIKTKTPVYLLWSLALSVTACTQKPAADYSGWATYAGSKEGIRYSSNTQINRNNVIKLKQVWTYSTGDRDTANKSQIQCNPIVINGTLYGTSPMLKLFALDAASGRQ